MTQSENIQVANLFESTSESISIRAVDANDTNDMLFVHRFDVTSLNLTAVGISLMTT